MNRLRILVADGSATYRNMFSRAAPDAVSCASVTCVANGAEARESIKRNDFEIIIIDAEIAEIFALLKEIMVQLPKAFVLVTARPSITNDRLCAEALTIGAGDYITKPIHSSYTDNYNIVKAKLTEIVSAFGVECAPPQRPRVFDPARNREGISKSSLRPGIVLIAASTGGPLALESILSKLSKSFPVPILVVQHMLLQFTNTLAHNLNQKTLLDVKIAISNETVKAGTVYIAPGGMHMKLDSNNAIRLDGSPPINGVRPAADILFESVAESYMGPGVLSVILTGMGRDGEYGLAKLKEKQECYCLAQSEKSCVVYGMPRAAFESGYVDKVLDLADIPSEIESFSFA